MTVAVGGGGLIAGLALAMKTLNPEIKVIGVEPKRCASFTAALAAGKPVHFAGVKPTLADGLAVPQVGAHAFAVARHWVDEVVTVEERDVALGVLRLVEGEKMVVEGGGATGLAGLLPGGPLDRPDLKGKTVVVPLCGGNIDITVLGRVIERGLAADGSRWMWGESARWKAQASEVASATSFCCATFEPRVNSIIPRSTSARLAGDSSCSKDTTCSRAPCMRWKRP